MAFTPTTIDEWTRSDRYHNQYLITPNSSLESALRLSEKYDLPPYAVSAAQGKFLNLLAKSIHARRILEIGTLGGYSTIWLANALPKDGELVTCEISEKYAQVRIQTIDLSDEILVVKIAQTNIENSHLNDRVKILIGPALATLPTLAPDASFDLAFIDADKQSNVAYFEQAKRLVRHDGIIIVDNVVRNGHVADPDKIDPSIAGVRKLLEYIRHDSTVEATTVSTVGEKGYDGFLYAINKPSRNET